MVEHHEEAGLIASVLNIYVDGRRRDVKNIFCHNQRERICETSTEQHDPVSRRLPSLALLRTQHRWEPKT